MRRPSDLQVLYQRNLLYALLITIGLAALGFVAILCMNAQPVEEIIQHSTVIDIRITEDLKGGTPIKAKRSLRGYNPYAQRHDGFLGFLDIRSSPNARELITLDPPPIYSLADVDLEISEDFPFSFSAEEGNDIGVYISDETDFIFTPRTTDSYPLSSSGFNKEIAVVRYVKPEYPWIARQAGKEGQVFLLVYIDSSGALSSFPEWLTGHDIKSAKYSLDDQSHSFQYAVREEPESWFFAEKLLDVLPRWIFSPYIENGVPVGALLRIRHIFCLGPGCLEYELELVSPLR